MRILQMHSFRIRYAHDLEINKFNQSIRFKSIFYNVLYNPITVHLSKYKENYLERIYKSMKLCKRILRASLKRNRNYSDQNNFSIYYFK